MSDKLQLMLINVLSDQFLNIKVSQGSVATRLRSDGILNDQFITQSLLSPKVKKFWKLVNICRSYGHLSTGLFFMKHGVEACCQYSMSSTRMRCCNTVHSCNKYCFKSGRMRLLWTLRPTVTLASSVPYVSLDMIKTMKMVE